MRHDWTEEHEGALVVLERLAALVRPSQEQFDLPQWLIADILELQSQNPGRPECWGLHAVVAYGRLRKRGFWGEDLLIELAKQVGAKPNPASVRQQLKALRARVGRDLDEVTERAVPTAGDRFAVSGDESVLAAIAVVLDWIPKPKGI